MATEEPAAPAAAPVAPPTEHHDPMLFSGGGGPDSPAAFCLHGPRGLRGLARCARAKDLDGCSICPLHECAHCLQPATALTPLKAPATLGASEKGLQNIVVRFTVDVALFRSWAQSLENTQPRESTCSAAPTLQHPPSVRSEVPRARRRPRGLVGRRVPARPWPRQTSPRSRASR